MIAVYNARAERICAPPCAAVVVWRLLQGLTTVLFVGDYQHSPRKQGEVEWLVAVLPHPNASVHQHVGTEIKDEAKMMDWTKRAGDTRGRRTTRGRHVAHCRGGWGMGWGHGILALYTPQPHLCPPLAFCLVATNRPDNVFSQTPTLSTFGTRSNSPHVVWLARGFHETCTRQRPRLEAIFAKPPAAAAAV
ncbi:hypothetical protein ANO11243_052430 [Dothideomycetidae sp. 11243]|nr:hypothetical protein ANO11243_052430 [fungal sp. No.11243]